MSVIDIDRHLAVDNIGRVHIAGRRINVALIATLHVRHGQSFESISEDYDLAPAQIHAALAFYYDHKDLIDQEIAEEGRRATEYAKANPNIVLKAP